MALVKSEDTGLGVQAPSAYHRVGFVKGPPDELRVRVDSYYDKAAHRSGSRPYAQRVFTVSLDTGAPKNLLTSVYQALKASDQHGRVFASGTQDDLD